MRHTEYGYVSPAENHCYRDLERWLADKKKRERRANKHGAFNLKNKQIPVHRASRHIEFNLEKKKEK
ncbi:hypothetical protein [Levilactobacillus brevis]|uniref:hypothetical protein n=1 Tax=Levilactobacillus brevis TaxID=1580 RepID=UPI000403A92E|nr:hypothetical protein [Levilactobacillus brevis]KID44333.1 hypothetical protein LbDm2_0798 [Levilactobacillus brevis]